MNVLVINCCPVKNGATAEIVDYISRYAEKKNIVKTVCVDDYDIYLCKGCRCCHKTASCVQSDDTTKLMEEFDWADKIICVSPSYWADVPGQFKVFIDRCTPWCNTHKPHSKLQSGKKGYAIALRTGPNIKEREKILHTIEHFYSHLEIKMCGGLGLCSVENKSDVSKHIGELNGFFVIHSFLCERQNGCKSK